MPWESKKWRGVTLMFLHYQMVVVSVHWVVHKVEVEQSAQTTILFCPLYWIEPLRRETTLCALSIKYYFFRDRNVTNKLFPMFLLWLFSVSLLQEWKGGAHHVSPLVLGQILHSRSSPQNVVCSVATWAERWGQDVLIYNACYRDPSAAEQLLWW